MLVEQSHFVDYFLLSQAVRKRHMLNDSSLHLQHPPNSEQPRQRPSPHSSRSARKVKAVVRGVLDIKCLSQVELARMVVPVLVKPDLGAVRSLAAVDVEVHVAVGHGGNPELLSACCIRSDVSHGRAIRTSTSQSDSSGE